MRVIGLGWFGFWILLATLVGCGTYCYLKTPQNPILDMLKSTQEERLIRNLQDPLAMRLYALKLPLSEIPSQTSGEVYKELITAVIKQWSEEVGSMKAAAYHAKAADTQWDISKLPLNKEQKDALIEVSGNGFNVMGSNK